MNRTWLSLSEQQQPTYESQPKKTAPDQGLFFAHEEMG
jgi:hypothetical protein